MDEVVVLTRLVCLLVCGFCFGSSREEWVNRTGQTDDGIGLGIGIGIGIGNWIGFCQSEVGNAIGPSTGMLKDYTHT